MNHYLVGVLASQRLADLRAQAIGYNVARRHGAPRRPLRVALGGWLIVLGRLALGESRARSQQGAQGGRLA
jgi:hypothetical protein